MKYNVIPGLILIGCLGVGCSQGSTPSEGRVHPAVPKTEIEMAQAAVEKAPGFSAYISLGLALSRAGKISEAVVAFEHAAEVSPNSPVAYNNICSEYNGLGRWVDAIENCRKALAIEPGFVLAKNNLGFAEKSRAAEENGLKFVKGRMGEGESADRKRIDLGMVYYREGHYDKAISTWTEIPSGSESYAAAQNNIASALIILKKFDLAKPHIDTALRLKPREPLFQNNRKWLETAKRDSENLAVGTHSTQ